MRKIILSLISVILLTSSVLANDVSELVMNRNISETPIIEVVTDAEELAKYSKVPEFDANNVRSDSETRGTTIPTKTMDLGADYDTQSYSFVNYIYSNYKYIPNGSTIAISFLPTTNYPIDVTVYDASTYDAVANYNNLFLENGTQTTIRIRNLSTSKKYFVKFSSPTGNRLQGSYILE